MKPIKHSVINTFERVGIDYNSLDNKTKNYRARNIFTGEEVETTALIAFLVNWVYQTSMEYEQGYQKVKVADFDRIRFFILDQDPVTYSKCID